MYCPHCGAQTPDNAKFCSSCGQSLTTKGAPSKNSPSLRPLVILLAVLTVALGVVLSLFIARLDGGVRTYDECMALAARYLEELDFEQAEALYLEAIEIDASQEAAYRELASLYLQQSRADDALAVLERGIEATGSTELRVWYEELLESVQTREDTEEVDSEPEELTYQMQDFKFYVRASDGTEVYYDQYSYPVFSGKDSEVLNEYFTNILNDFEFLTQDSEDGDEWIEEYSEAGYDMESLPNYLPFYREYMTEITYIDDTYLSYTGTTGFWSGGAHPYHYSLGTILKRATGKEISYLDLLPAGESLESIVETYDTSGRIHVYNGLSPEAYYLTEEGLILCFNQGDAVERISLVIPFEALVFGATGVAEETGWQEAEDAYRLFLEQDGYRADMDEGLTDAGYELEYYAILDIDANGVPELLVSTTLQHDINGYLYALLYAYGENGGVTFVDRIFHGGELRYSPSRQALTSRYTELGYSTWGIMLLTYQDGRLEWTEILATDGNGNPWLVNAEDESRTNISEDEYASRLEQWGLTEIPLEPF